MIWLMVTWYVTVQVVALAVLPLTLRVMRALPDRGYSLAKISGILLTGVVFWLAVSYGLLRNERGGAWVALMIVAATSWLVGYGNIGVWWRSLRGTGGWRAVITTEVIFALAFVGWALVRAHDPAANHTEQPMDLMFMNSIWSSPTFPPQDAWLAGYGISYYYLGYWLLTTLGRLAGTTPNLAYNLGQAVWYGYLWLGCFAVVMNLLAWRFSREASAASAERVIYRIPGWGLAGGVLGGVAVALIGNLQGIIEWLYAQGVDVGALAAWTNVRNFPQNASQTGQWFISYDWWWWRSSRIIGDTDIAGNYIELIDEFPMFSYLLGDNHPHVMAMPVVLLVVGLALNLFLLFTQRQFQALPSEEPQEKIKWLPLDAWDAAVYLIALGSLVFLNTWDYPPYWLLMVAVVLIGLAGAWGRAFLIGGGLFLGTVLLYLPYFLTAQSQAGGIIPNVFYPTRLTQFWVMFGTFLPALIGLSLLGWRLIRPSRSDLIRVTVLVLGVPLSFLLLATLLSTTEWGQVQLSRLEELPDGMSYTSFIIDRWLGSPWTFLFVGALLSVITSSLFAILKMPMATWRGWADVVFVLMLAAVGLLMVFAPEIIFLRDYFGTRMNTIFKFYYQGWLLFGLASAYLITIVVRHLPKRFALIEGLTLVSLVLIAGALLFPIAGIYSRTNGFQRDILTFDATAYAKQSAPDVMAAVEWVQLNTTPNEVILEGVGNSYRADTNRISTMTGRPTLLGWDGHESQWRGEAYREMAAGRAEAIETIYRRGPVEEITNTLATWDIDYVFVGPAEIERYGITSGRLEELGAALDTVFERGQVRIFRRRES